MGNFVHLHMHTEYSLLDGANRIKDLVKKIKELGMTSVAITDHGNMFGVVEFYKECIASDIKPIIGCEVYVAPRSRLEREGRIDAEPNHLILLAMNNVGYKNLVKLCSLAYTEGFYYKPRVDIEILAEYSEGLIALSGCMAGVVASLILDGNMEGAKNTAIKYSQIFKDRFYLEIQDNKYPEQLKVNQHLITISRELNIPLVATNDCHYLTKEDYLAHEVLMCIQTKKKLQDSDRMTFKTNEFYVKSEEEMRSAFKNFQEAIDNTGKIADMCNVTLEFGHYILPEYKTEGLSTDSVAHYEYFKNMCYNAIPKKYPENMHDLVKKRLDYEIQIISKMGFIDYFLIVSDFINYAKSQNIPVGPGRGSGAGSIAAYLSNITDIDPLRFGLIFERFLNPERISMPDFDVDFCYTRREEVIEYVSKKYGKDHVAQIITFGTLKAKAAIRDVARVLDMPYFKADEIAKLIPFEHGVTIDSVLAISKELKDMYDLDMDVKRLLDIAKTVEGLPRNASTHAAGVVIAKSPVSDYVPLYLSQEQISTQYTMTILEELGLLKMDFLGLRTLTVIQDTIDMVKQNRNIDLVFDAKYDDEAVYKNLSLGKTVGVFQMESAGFTEVIKRLKPEKIEDIIALISLYRPGPMDEIPRYIAVKNGEEKIKYTHPLLEPILKETNGCIVYQEQVMQIFRSLAGYSLSRADLVRRAMGKKKIEVMNKERHIFINGLKDEKGKVQIEGCKSKGISEDVANKIFDEMADFAKYAFNKSHAAAYAVVAYKTAYLKFHYMPEFMAAMMNSFLGNQDKIPGYVAECKLEGINVLKPNINESEVKFSATENNIRFALATIKNVGEGAIELIVEERKKHGKYTSLVDFLQRTSSERINKKCVESLIRAGAFDELERNFNRYDMLESFENIMDSITSSRRNNLANQVNLFDISRVSSQKISGGLECKKCGRDITTEDILAMEKEMTGMYLSGNPLDDYIQEIKSLSTITATELNSLGQSIMEDNFNISAKELESKQNTLCGLISFVKPMTTKSGKQMAFVNIQDMYDEAETIVFPNVYSKYQSMLSVGTPVMVKGKISIKDDEKSKILVEEVKRLNKNMNQKLYIRIPKEKLTCVTEKEFNNILGSITNLVKNYPGTTPVYIYFEANNKLTMLARKWWTALDSKVINILKQNFGEDNIRLK